MSKRTKSTDAQDHGAIYAHDGGAFVAAGAASTDANGQTRRRFLKDFISDGTFYDANGTAHTITPERREQWVAKFDRMKSASVDVPVPEEHTSLPSDRRGTVTRMWNAGNSLWGEVELVGDDAIKLASTAKVSIYAPEAVRLGDGTVIKDAIEHVALTDYPVVSKQNGFIPIAASGKSGTVNVPVCRMGRQQEQDMKWQDIAATIGFDITGLDDTTGPDKVNEALKSFAEKAKAGTEQVATLTASLKAANEKGKPVEVDPDILTSRGEVVEVKLSALVDSGKITPKVKTALLDLCTKGAAAGLCLSKKAAEAAGFALPIADALIAILKDNEPKDLKASTGLQSGMALSRATPGAKGNTDSDRAAVNLMCELSGAKKPN